MSRVIFIGAGNIAKAHLDAVRIVGSDVVGVCTRSDSGKVFSQQNGIPHFSTSITELINSCQPDAVMVLTQPQSYPGVLKSLEPFDLPTFLEKPVGYNVKDAERLKSYLPRKVFVGLNRRFYSNIRAVYPLLMEEQTFLAQLTLPERVKDFAHRDPVTRENWMMLNGIHGIDLICYLAGYPQKVLTSKAWGELPEVNLCQYYAGLYETERGHTVSFASHVDSSGGWRIHIFLKQREIIISPFEKTMIKSLSGVEEVALSPQDQVAKPGFVAQAQAFLSGGQGEFSWVSFDDALKSMQAIEMLFYSHAASTFV